ncbi:hypothetical protein PHYPSEUDO_006820 [Phytophthora pseudosyringae]|uniref:Uncharacterized protein n=1 Tax=Phytophthora pseudosyringae TaxID=221518 RepID=A0A8T1VIG8_9STRA|nr:hypothetical protein PHYPSEUDO_006820 [Phytophthora pseudosyringae]
MSCAGHTRKYLHTYASYIPPIAVEFVPSRWRCVCRVVTALVRSLRSSLSCLAIRLPRRQALVRSLRSSGLPESADSIVSSISPSRAAAHFIMPPLAHASRSLIRSRAIVPLATLWLHCQRSLRVAIYLPAPFWLWRQRLSCATLFPSMLLLFDIGCWWVHRERHSVTVP